MKYQTSDNKIIVINKETEEHLAAHPEVLKLLQETISKVKITNSELRFGIEVDLGRKAGISNLVETQSVAIDQKTDFAYRKARQYPSHVVLNRKGEDCDAVTLDIRYDKDTDDYTLATAYIGHICPDEPFYFQDKTSAEFKESLEFWSNHTLVYNEAVMEQTYQSCWKIELSKGARDSSF